MAGERDGLCCADEKSVWSAGEHAVRACHGHLPPTGSPRAGGAVGELGQRERRVWGLFCPTARPPRLMGSRATRPTATPQARPPSPSPQPPANPEFSPAAGHEPRAPRGLTRTPHQRRPSSSATSAKGLLWAELSRAHEAGAVKDDTELTLAGKGGSPPGSALPQTQWDSLLFL